MTRLNTQFSVKGISLLNSVMASSSSVQFKKFLFNQVDDIAGNEVSPTKQARGDSGKEPKLHWWQNGEKTLGETRLSRGAISPLARWHSSSIPTAAKSDWRAQLVPEVFSWWLSRWRGPHWGSVSGAHLGVLVSADIQGCRGRLYIFKMKKCSFTNARNVAVKGETTIK